MCSLYFGNFIQNVHMFIGNIILVKFPSLTTFIRLCLITFTKNILSEIIKIEIIRKWTKHFHIEKCNYYLLQKFASYVHAARRLLASIITNKLIFGIVTHDFDDILNSSLNSNYSDCYMEVLREVSVYLYFILFSATLLKT